jgi:hypothetical protein
MVTYFSDPILMRHYAMSPFAGDSGVSFEAFLFLFFRGSPGAVTLVGMDTAAVAVV